jgi:DNA-binding IclR family transcriptional regulator
VLFLFTGAPGALGVSGISRQLNLSKAVVHRILQSLVSCDFLRSDADGRGYRLGSAAAALGARALGELDIRRAALPVLDRLRSATRETTTLSVLIGESRVYLEQRLSPQEIRMSVELGRPYPLHAGSTGKAMLAFLDADTRERILSSGLQRLTPATTTDPQRLRAELVEIVARGYAVSHGEREHDAAAVASPVLGIDGEVTGALSICGPVTRFDEPTVALFGPQVHDAAIEVSRSLGWGD